MMVDIPSELINQFILLWFLPFIRILAMLATTPIFDGRMINRRVRIGLAAIVAYLLAASGAVVIPEGAGYLSMILQQILVGVTLGFFIRLVFAALELAGDAIGLQMGLGFAMFVNPQENTQSPLLGSFFNIMATLVFLSMNGHLMALDALIQSFKVVPVSADFSFLNPEKIVQAGSMMFAIGLQLSLPVVACVLAVNIALGMLSKASPQMNIISVGFSVTIIVGFIVLWMALPFFAAFFEASFNQMFQIPIWNRVSQP